MSTHLSGLPVGIIRGISDRADGTKNGAEDRERQPRAAANAAAFAVRLSTNLTTERIQRMVTELGSVKDRLLAAAPERKQPRYESLGLAPIFDVKKRTVIVESQPSCTYGECPRGDLNPHAR
ncbi:hypothetical protein [Streptomyces rapamycinicus]|uniref:Uncharacterized protein n=1 Tax=Streptomyces rapamycinicus (strain ATCC 29253 / DSM 41530 / NRRL 5491 / AYB-994) TaxID=1343740 RepID=A0A3L8R292_STRRN|nr:hypothetical protein D3C57_131050 [Streptomyces rapamycinicus NRRL 5491]